MKIFKIFVIILFILIGSVLVMGSVSYKTVYNPFTGKLDYVINEDSLGSSNMTINCHNITGGTDTDFCIDTVAAGGANIWGVDTSTNRVFINQTLSGGIDSLNATNIYAGLNLYIAGNALSSLFKNINAISGNKTEEIIEAGKPVFSNHSEVALCYTSDLNISNLPETTTINNKEICNKADGNCNQTSLGDITAVNTAGEYVYGGAATGDVNLLFNETKLNKTIDARDSDTTYTAGSNISISSNVISLNVPTLKTYLDLIYNPLSDLTIYYSSTANFSNSLNNYSEAEIDAFVANNGFANASLCYTSAANITNLLATTTINNKEICNKADGNCNQTGGVTYTAGSNISISSNVISLNVTTLKFYLDLLYKSINSITGNSTSEIWNIINNGTFKSAIINDGNTTAQILFATRDYYYNYTEHIYYSNITACADTQILKVSGTEWACVSDNSGGGDNTTYMIMEFVNNKTYLRSYTNLSQTNVQTYINSSNINLSSLDVRYNVTASWIIALLNYSNIMNSPIFLTEYRNRTDTEIRALVPYNTSNQIWNVINNGTFLTFYSNLSQSNVLGYTRDYYYNYTEHIHYFNITVCADTQILKVSGTEWTCAADSVGTVADNNTYMVTEYVKNQTYKLSTVNDGNTSSQIFNVCNNETFLDKDKSISAANISSGTFGAGNYIFPNNVTVGNNFTLKSNSASSSMFFNGTHILWN